MEQGQLNWIANFIWGIADDVLRDLYVRGKYRDVILPMTVLRRLDAVLEPTKQAVLGMKASLDKAKIVHQDQALRQAAGQAFYNASQFTLRDLRARRAGVKIDTIRYYERRALLPHPYRGDGPMTAFHQRRSGVRTSRGTKSSSSSRSTSPLARHAPMSEATQKRR